MREHKLVWVVYYWLRPFLNLEQTKWEKFDTREEARKYLRKVKLNPLFVIADDIKQYKYYHLETL